jgi:hypothetical protein
MNTRAVKSRRLLPPDFNPRSGHLKSCCYNRKDPVPTCLHYDATKTPGCGQLASDSSESLAKACLRFENEDGVGKLVGLCDTHWSEYCKDHKWDVDLSYCANIACDRQELTPEVRATIHQHNISRLLGISGLKRYYHVSKQRRHTLGKDDLSSHESDNDALYVDDEVNVKKRKSANDTDNSPKKSKVTVEPDNFCTKCCRQRSDGDIFCGRCGKKYT